MSTPQQPPNPATPQNKLGNILEQIHKYTDIAAQAVLQAQQEGVGLQGTTKAQMALGFAHTGLRTAGALMPNMEHLADAERQLEPIFIPMFTSLVNLLRSHGHPAFVQPAANVPANSIPQK